ncbi:MAG: DUF2851 family protein [Dehalococcoidales bacterium]|nr:DUF2851 family protein [Dehalococcoidales bacterium]
MPGTLSENRVLQIWQDRLSGRNDLVTEGGEPVRVVYPGRRNGDRGADFRDAVVAIGGGVTKGDIEVHVRSSGWRAHHHHRDPVYNRVVLHVVFRHDTTGDIILQNGKRVPTLALERFTDTAIPAAAHVLPCRKALRRRDADFIGGVLDEAGERRFDAWVDEFGEEIARQGASQSLYRGIMGALGYSKNKKPMLELAGRMPLKRLEAEIPKEMPDAECLEQYRARLMGIAGLTASPHAGEYPVNSPERIWADCRETATMSADGWRFFKVRPANSPVRRITAICQLLVRYREEGMIEGLMGVLEGAKNEDGWREMERTLTVEGDGCPALLGRERAAVIVVNVLLPFAVARGRLESRPGLTVKAMEIYRSYPPLAENALQRHMARQLGINRYVVSTARRQQGLLHIYKTLCSQGGCRDCPLV